MKGTASGGGCPDLKVTGKWNARGCSLAWNIPMGRDGGGGGGARGWWRTGASVLPRITGDGAAGTRPGSLDAELRSTLYPSELLHAAHPHKYNDTGIVPVSVPAC